MPLRVTGIEETRAGLVSTANDLEGQPMRDGMRKATLLVEGAAKKNAPVDTGRLRASITSRVDMTEKSVKGLVGSNVIYAPWVETGTRPHFPPTAALETWARRHGMNAFLVARAISRRGTRAHRYLRKAFNDSKKDVQAILGQTVKGIIRKKRTK